MPFEGRPPLALTLNRRPRSVPSCHRLHDPAPRAWRGVASLNRGPVEPAGRIAASCLLKVLPLKPNPPRRPDGLRICSERPEDAAQIAEITTAAFEPMPFSDGGEVRVVAGLRKADAYTLSLVAIATDGNLVGHIAFSPVRIDGQPSDWYGLGPVSVAPATQRRGIGSALILEGLDRLKDLGAGGCVLLGDPNYYARFGFQSVPTLTYRGKPNRYFQRLVLRGPPPEGDVSFHPAFDS